MNAETGFARIKRAFEAYVASFKQAKAAHESVSDLVSSAEYELEQVKKAIAASGVKLNAPAQSAAAPAGLTGARGTNVFPLRPRGMSPPPAQPSPSATRAAGLKRSSQGT